MLFLFAARLEKQLKRSLQILIQCLVYPISVKTRVIISVILFLLSGAFLISAMENDGYGPFKPTPLTLPVPKGWPKPNNIFKNNPLTVEGFELGRKLFYDPMFSRDSTISCASCHQQFASFATFDHDLSHGINNTFTTRNAPSLFNLAWMKEYHWDGGVNHIEVQPLSPIHNSNEMGGDMNNIISYIQSDTTYLRMFRSAFGNVKITSQKVLKALAQFSGSLVSSNSKYDKVKRGENSFTRLEQKGYDLFKSKCASCHKEPLFTDYSYRNNGQPLNRFSDVGRMKITGYSEDSLKFKVPSLRNVQVTSPYMHDGRLFALPQVIEHYNKGILTDQPTLDPILKNRIEINNTQMYELMYFLFTLTDSTFLKDPRFAGKQTDASTFHK
jgi:cytochrome c peroxidase